MLRRRTLGVAAATLALAAAPAVVARQSHAGHYVAPAPVCGSARWPVKTLADSAAASIDTKLTPVTVLGLTTLPAPDHVGDKLPRQTGFGGAEFKTYKLSVRLVGWKLSDNDSDIHIHVEGRGLFAPQTMVVEFPLAGCIAKSASATNRAKMASAKAALNNACRKTHRPTTSMLKLVGTATITGVRFFDKSHGGGAPHGSLASRRHHEWRCERPPTCTSARWFNDVASVWRQRWYGSLEPWDVRELLCAERSFCDEH
jgi:hypothetical protein